MNKCKIYILKIFVLFILFNILNASDLGLIVEKSNSLSPGSFSSMPLTLDNGKISISNEESDAFYRLGISSKSISIFGTVNTSDYGSSLTIANQYLASLDELGTYEIAETAILYHSPVTGEPSHIEFSIISDVAGSTDENTGNIDNTLSYTDHSFLGYDSNILASEKKALGFIVVNLDKSDLPIDQYSLEASSFSSQLLSKLYENSENNTDLEIKIIYFDSSFIVAEDSNNPNISLAHLGTPPFSIDAGILKEVNAHSGINEGLSLNGDLFLNMGENYADFKNQFSHNPEWILFRNNKAEYAKVDWAIIDDDVESISIIESIGQSPVKISDTSRTVISFDIDGETSEDELGNISSEDPIPIFYIEGGVLYGYSLTPAGTVCTIVYDDYSISEQPVLFISDNQSTPNALATRSASSITTRGHNWTSWSGYSIDGNTTAMTQYGGITSCRVSGCGPTAWAIVFEWWDREKSKTNLITSSFDKYDCISWLYSQMGTYCVSGQAATNPWRMDDGAAYFAHRGYSYSYSHSWASPYTSNSPWKRARDSIRYNDAPAVYGVGLFSHYVVAECYQYRKYKKWGITLRTQRKFRCNWGHGDSTDRWKTDVKNSFFGVKAKVN